MRTWTPWLVIGLATAALVHGCVIDTVDDCYDDGSCVGPGGSGPMGGGVTTSDGGSGAAGGSTGGGGMTGCMDHDECTMADAAQCDAGSCVACTDNEHCDGVAGLGVCDDGECVECLPNEEAACDDNTETCHWQTKDCTSDPPPNSVANCLPCSNDGQCMDGVCVPLDFQGTLHGHYCLEEGMSCLEPFAAVLTKTSVNGDSTSVCGLKEDNTTCEAVFALEDLDFCSGADGMCSETQGGIEEPVTGALCRQVGSLTGMRCTYACNATEDCPPTGQASTCGDGMGATIGWCGG